MGIGWTTMATPTANYIASKSLIFYVLCSAVKQGFTGSGAVCEYWNNLVHSKCLSSLPLWDFRSRGQILCRINFYWSHFTENLKYLKWTCLQQLVIFISITENEWKQVFHFFSYFLIEMSLKWIQSCLRTIQRVLNQASHLMKL